MSNSAERAINFIGVLGPCGMIIGAMIIEFGYDEQPCPLCLLQRLAMIGLAASCLMNLHLGIKPAHYGLGIFSCFFGGSVSLRQTFLHIVPGSPPGPSTPVMGFDLWWWAFISFLVAAIAISIALIFYKPDNIIPTDSKLTKVSFIILLLVSFSNIIITFSLCRTGPCAG